jgi:hypothetical protein
MFPLETLLSANFRVLRISLSAKSGELRVLQLANFSCGLAGFSASVLVRRPALSSHFVMKIPNFLDFHSRRRVRVWVNLRFLLRGIHKSHRVKRLGLEPIRPRQGTKSARCPVGDPRSIQRDPGNGFHPVIRLPTTEGRPGFHPGRLSPFQRVRITLFGSTEN